MTALLQSTVERENLGTDSEVIEAVVEVADGCARQALVLLEQVSKVESPAKAMDLLLENSIGQRELIDLCKEVVSQKAHWDRAVVIYRGLASPEPEKIRRALLGYVKSCLLGSKAGAAADRYCALIRIFSPNCYDGGEALFLAMLYEACLT
jgi:DNA polymerase III gamma/tau subunit